MLCHVQRLPAVIVKRQSSLLSLHKRFFAVAAAAGQASRSPSESAGAGEKKKKKSQQRSEEELKQPNWAARGPRWRRAPLKRIVKKLHYPVPRNTRFPFPEWATDLSDRILCPPFPPDPDASHRVDLTEFPVLAFRNRSPDDESLSRFAFSLDPGHDGTRVARLYVHVPDPTRWINLRSPFWSLLVSRGAEFTLRASAGDPRSKLDKSEIFTLLPTSFVSTMSFGGELSVPSNALSIGQRLDSLVVTGDAVVASRIPRSVTFIDQDMLTRALAAPQAPLTTPEGALQHVYAYCFQRMQARLERGGIRFPLGVSQPKAENNIKVINTELKLLAAEEAARFSVERNLAMIYAAQDRHVQIFPPGQQPLSYTPEISLTYFNHTPKVYANAGLAYGFCPILNPLAEAAELLLHFQIKAALRGTPVPYKINDQGVSLRLMYDWARCKDSSIKNRKMLLDKFTRPRAKPEPIDAPYSETPLEFPHEDINMALNYMRMFPEFSAVGHRLDWEPTLPEPLIEKEEPEPGPPEMTDAEHRAYYAKEFAYTPPPPPAPRVEKAAPARPGKKR
eukprot:gnl/Spiro4/11552_TR6099_c0_g1_i1.p1 gnl/Spiro4/11552_TR6099_c0_g1~~gnl/Spiro4/11552_TR6099_c0_g1_i1.p1  ORF type:complete len:562 (-),score=100.17 gnl/Spiro4/11552_TR6099_c0_g1_i1:134-1819(-)